MTRRHFVAIAAALRAQHPIFRTDRVTFDIGSDIYWSAERQWERDVLAMADTLAMQSAAPRFDRARFLQAAGYSHRPDGSMFPVK